MITHDESIAVPGQHDQQVEHFAPGSLTFTPDPKVPIEETLLDFISRETGKMKSLARSDMDSFLQFGQELINISKPFYLEGIGTLQRNPKNQLEFLQSSEDLPQDPYQRTSSAQKSGRKTISAPSSDTLKKLGLILVALSLLFAAVMVVRWFLNQKTIEESTIQEPVQQSSPTPVTDTPQVSPIPTNGSPEQFAIVLERSNRQRAIKRYADLKQWGHNVKMVTRDSVTFKLYILINAPLSDTARHRDSLRVFFNRRVWVETNPNEKP